MLSWWWLPVWMFALAAPVALGVSLMYHRVLTHRSAVISPLVAYPLVAIAAPAGTPVGWIGNHRHHHRVTDTADDPHSPGEYGFWYAHAGWYLGVRSVPVCILYSVAGPIRMLFDAWWRPRTGMEFAHLARDVARDPFYRWLSRPGPYAAVVVSHVLITWSLTWLLFGPWALVVLYALQVGYFVLGDAVNSWTHLHGDRPFRSDDHSGNVAWLALLTAGDGWHHNHHVFPTSIRHGLLPGQVDPSYGFCRGLQRLGLASDLREPSPEMLRARLVNPRPLRSDVRPLSPRSQRSR